MRSVTGAPLVPESWHARRYDIRIFGGSRLPKDVTRPHLRGRLLEVDTPALGSILVSNQLHIAHAVSMIHGTGQRRVAPTGR